MVSHVPVKYVYLAQHYTSFCCLLCLPPLFLNAVYLHLRPAAIRPRAQKLHQTADQPRSSAVTICLLANISHMRKTVSLGQDQMRVDSSTL